eukprot:COSAG06_NODE_28_length_32009_cov_31.553463_11_plen_70_part_00
MQTKNVGSQANDGAMRTQDTWHRNHAKHANADDLRSRPNKGAQINVCTFNIYLHSFYPITPICPHTIVP